MDVRTLCLGVLSQGDFTGYDIKKFFESSFSRFFPAGYGSIYPALAQLLDQQLVTCLSLPQDKLPDKKIYRITEQGQQSFRDALEAGKGSHRLRSEFLVQMFFAEHIEPQRLTEILDMRLSAIDRELSSLDNAVGEHTPGANFTRGFTRNMLEASRTYIRDQRVQLESVVAEQQMAKAG